MNKKINAKGIAYKAEACLQSQNNSIKTKIKLIFVYEITLSLFNAYKPN